MDLPYAEKLNYYKTSTVQPDTWIEKAKNQIEKSGGRVVQEGFGRESETGNAAFMLIFEIGGDHFKIVWPVLPTRDGKGELAAKKQAATFMYHDVKAKCLAATVLGARTAFFSYLLLPDGRSTAEASIPELTKGIPKLLKGE